MEKYVDKHGRVAEVHTDINGKCFAYIKDKREYSPLFPDKKNLVKWLVREGYEEVT